MTQDCYKMFQRAAAKICDESGGAVLPAHTYAVQAPQEIHSRGHFNDQGIISHSLSIYDPSHIKLLIVEVWGFNVADVDYELSLVFTDTDMRQFR